MIPRQIEQLLFDRLFKKKVIIVLGARQTGKTTLLKNILKNQENYVWLNADESDVQKAFEEPNAVKLKNAIGNASLVCIDEAQRIKNIGIVLKIIYDTYPEIQVIATGSSAFELANKVNEPLTGRKFEFELFPISTAELVNQLGELTESRNLEHRLVYGFYPEVINNFGNEREILKLLSDSYLYKDILLWQNIKKPEKLILLLQALAHQMGHQVSFNELANTIGLDAKTVEIYIQLLEKSFVIFRLPSYSKNLRNELKFSRKIYFYDNGIRNSILSNFQLASSRTDIGALWENYLISERKKRNTYNNCFIQSYFWRTKEQQEIDYLEEIDGKLSAFEFKWSKTSKAKIPLTFSKNYPDAVSKIITPDNYLEFVI